MYCRFIEKQSIRLLFLILLLGIYGFPGRTLAFSQEKITSFSVAYCRDCVPFQFTNPAGEPDGIIMDYWKTWSEKKDVSVTFIPAPWNETIEMVRNGRADLHAGLGYTQDREMFLQFGAAIRNTQTHIFFHKDVYSPQAMKGIIAFRIGVLAGDMAQTYLKEAYPDATIVGFKTYDDLIEALRNDQIKVFAADKPTALYHLGLKGLDQNFRYTADKPLYESPWRIAGGGGKDKLMDEINGWMENFPLPERRKIDRKWFPDSADRFYKRKAYSLELTAEEEVWLRAHPHIRVAAMASWPPMDFVGPSGTPVGIGADYVRALNERLGNILEITPGPFKENLEKVKAGEMDALLDVTPRPDRNEFLHFTHPYLTIPHVIVARKDGEYYASETDLAGKILALEKGFFSVKYFRENYPDVTVEEYPDTAKALDAVARGSADAYAGNRAVAAWVMEQEIMSNLQIHGRLNREGSVLAVGIRKDWPELASILEKAMDSISIEDQISIRRKWINLAESEKMSTVRLSQEEKAWLADRKEPVVVGAETDWPPYDFVRDDKVVGYSNDLLRLIAGKTGLPLKFITGDTWSRLLEKFEKGEVDILPAVYKTPEREKTMALTKYYAANPSVLVIHENETNIRSFNDLSQYKLAVPEGFSISRYLLENRPDISLMLVSNVLEGLKAVSLRKADAFVGSLGVISYFLKENLIPGLRIVDEVVLEKDDATKLHMAVNQKQMILHGIVQKGLDAVTETERNQLGTKWLGAAAVKSRKERFRLTAPERNWLKQAGPVRMSVDPNWLPIEHINPETGNYEGIAGAYIRLISKITGVKFELVPTANWSESMKLARSGEIDMLAACSKTREREDFMNFTLPFLTLSNAVVMQSNTPFLTDIGELAGKRVGVSEGTSIHRYLKENYPDLILVPNKGSLKGLKMVADGQVDAYVDTLEVVGFLINTHGLFNLKVALRLPKKRELHIALRKGSAPELLSILNKGIQSVTPEEKNGFYRRWISLHVEETIDYTLLWKIGIPVISVVLIIFGIISFWNRKLAKEIIFRKKVEAKLSDALDVITASIRYASRIQRSVLPSDEAMQALLNGYFVLWKPRDVVGGDIYWGTRWGSGVLVLLGDCTGHGVPGAFMTLISTGALDRALSKVEEGNAAALIQRMHQLIQATLSQTSEYRDEGGSDDGLELGICYLPPDGQSMTFAGAGFPLFIADNKEIKIIKGDRKGIGYRAVPGDTVWSNHSIPIKKGLSFYMSSDGIFDQVGGPKRMGFGKKRFRKLLAGIQDVPMADQGDAIYRELETYQGDEKRRDDVSALGFRSGFGWRPEKGDRRQEAGDRRQANGDRRRKTGG